VKIVFDQHIPFLLETIRREWPEVQIYPMKPEKIDASAVRDADILIVRTRTKVNEQLLKESKVQLVCTATIGYDHIDTAYCESHGIRWMSCPGCNAQAVCDYIEEAIDEYIRASTPVLPLTIGVVGVGHVGSKVAAMAERKGMKVLLNDPPKGIGISLDKIGRNSDIITFHVPLKNSPAEYPTYHLCDEAFLAKCKPGALIINAARGSIVDEAALVRSRYPYIIDTWEGEPDINPAVLNGAFRASMHIAGYSVEGKRNASQMCLNAIAEQFSLPKIDLSTYPYIGPSAARKNNKNWLADISRTLKAHPKDFEALRKDYPLREG
jgi:erythronate-4-phosphate dehydrogenase